MASLQSLGKSTVAAMLALGALSPVSTAAAAIINGQRAPLATGQKSDTSNVATTNMRTGQEQLHKYRHYRVYDVGTFGGPASYLFAFPGIPSLILNNHGAIAGWADTSNPDPFPNYCFDPDCYAADAFVWKNGVLTDLGQLPGGQNNQVNWISANGVMSGVGENGQTDPLLTGLPEFRADLWQNGQLIDLGTLPEGGNQSWAFANNNSGLVVGAATNTVPDTNSIWSGLLSWFSGYFYQTRAFLWQNGAMQDLGTLGGSDAFAYMINERGAVAGVSYTSAAPGACSLQNESLFSLTTGTFIWDRKRGMVDIGDFGGSCTVPSAMNNRSQLVGASNLPGDQAYHPFFWDRATGLKDLGTLGGNVGIALGVNHAGHVVGGASRPGDAVYGAVLWQWKSGKWNKADLGTPTGATFAFGQSINASDQVVGFFDCSSGALCGFVWERGGSIVDLNTLVHPGSGLTIMEGLNINDNGEIGAYAADAEGNGHAVLLVPCDGAKDCE